MTTTTLRGRKATHSDTVVLFDLNKDAPKFSIRVRAQRFSPDMFYVNEFAERLNNHNKKMFQELFG